MGLFGRSEEQEKAQLTAAYNKWFDRLYAGECRSRGVDLLPLDVMRQLGNMALDRALTETYKVGQRIRVSDFEMQGLFTKQMQTKTLESIRRRAEGRDK